MKRKFGYVFSTILTFLLVLTVCTSIAFADKNDENTDMDYEYDSTEENSEDVASEENDEFEEEIVEFEEEMICNGVFVDDIEIGGKAVSEAKKVIKDYLNELLKKKLVVKANDKKATSTVEEIGATFAETDYVEQALNIGKFGNVVRRYKDLKDVENDKKVYDVEINFDDEEKLKKFIKEKATECNIQAKEPTMRPKGGRLPSSRASSSFTFTEGSNGMSIDKKQVKEELLKNVKKWDKKDIVIKAKVKETKPKHKLESLKKCNDRLAQFTTNYSSSSAARCTNISNATSKIDGSIVYPGETFSILDKIAPFTSYNGYQEAGSYSQGKVVDSLGGGVCQVSTTLYNAILRAELDIVMRNNHSMVVSYVPISADAMIASSASRDFKFKNNTEVPVYIEAYTSGRNVTFNIYGEETRASNRTIKFQNKILKTIQPGADVITKDNTKPTTYREVTQSAHVGYRAEYYKIVYIDGVEKNRIKVNTSYYQAAPKYITVGTKEKEKPSPKPTEEVGEATGAEVEDEVVPNANAPVAPRNPGTGVVAPSTPVMN